MGHKRAHAEFVSEGEGLLVVGCGVLLALSGYALLFGYPYNWPGRWSNGFTHRALGWGENMWVSDGELDQPICAIEFLRRHQVTGRAWTVGNYQSYLVWRLWPALKVNMDGRDYLYTAEDIRSENWALTSPIGLRAYIQRWGTDLLLLRHRALSPIHLAVLEQHLGWVFVYFDDQTYIMVAPTPERGPLIAEHGYHAIRPWGQQAVRRADAEAVLSEADRAIQGCPTAANFAHRYRAEALRLVGRYAEADEARRQAKPVRLHRPY
jgi:hypothetical protein